MVKTKTTNRKKTEAQKNPYQETTAFTFTQASWQAEDHVNRRQK